MLYFRAFLYVIILMKKVLNHSLLLVLMLLPFMLNAQQENLPHSLDLKAYFDEWDVEGSFLIYNSNEQTWHSYNEARNQQGFLPASTFKILNTLIGLDTGILEDSSSVFTWDGTKNWNEQWNQDLSLNRAFAVSCVPCYRAMARKVGLTRMQYYMQQVGYGSMDIQQQTLDNFWLTGDSRITPKEQVLFLRRLHDQSLPFSIQHLAVLKQIMLREAGENYQIYAKTGLTMQDGKDIGWYVGYVEANNNIYYFALNIEKESEEKNNNFFDARMKIAGNIFKSLNIL